MLKVRGLDHLVLVVGDVEQSLQWYQEALGLEGVRVEAWRAGEAPFPSVRIDDGTIIDIVSFGHPGRLQPHARNVDHFCLVVDEADFEALRSSGAFDVVDGPGIRFGARGDGTSIYVHDPDGNTVELRYY
jgi:catechol 2,3-dioxygenase-like lactoylglutathione lyase family enzyme